MFKSPSSRIRSLLLALGLAILAVPGCVAPLSGPPRESVHASAEERAEANLRLLDQVWEKVNERFYARDFNGADWASARERYRERVGQAEDTEALYDVINEMLAELKDAHTAALTPREYWEDYTAARALVGINLERIGDRWVVSETRPGSPAERAGVRPGWIVLSRDGEPLPQSRLSFLNIPGETYRWEFLDAEDRRRTVDLVAETMADWMPPEERIARDGWVYLRFDEFEPDYQRWLRSRLRTLRDAPGSIMHLRRNGGHRLRARLHAPRDVPGLILDLRRNGGGSVASLERIINDFFPHRVAYGTFITRGGREEHERSAWFRGAGYEGPLVVLIGEGSASSAEILAYVLRHYDRATLVGRPTAGVVIASQYFRLRDGGELQLGTYDFRTLEGDRLEGVGVRPHIEVTRELSALRAGRDPELEAAVEWLRGHAGEEAVAGLREQSREYGSFGSGAGSREQGAGKGRSP